jgi:hypothetical protein
MTSSSSISTFAVLIRVEVEAALTTRFGPRPDPLAHLTLFDFGVGPAFGMVGGLRIRNRAGRDVMEEARLEDPRGPEAFDDALRLANLKLERPERAWPEDAAEAPHLPGAQGAHRAGRRA